MRKLITIPINYEQAIVRLCSIVPLFRRIKRYVFSIILPLLQFKCYCTPYNALCFIPLNRIRALLPEEPCCLTWGVPDFSSHWIERWLPNRGRILHLINNIRIMTRQRWSDFLSGAYTWLWRRPGSPSFGRLRLERCTRPPLAGGSVRAVNADAAISRPTKYRRQQFAPTSIFFQSGKLSEPQFLSVFLPLPLPLRSSSGSDNSFSSVLLEDLRRQSSTSPHRLTPLPD